MEEDLWPEASLIFELLEGDEPLAPGALVALEEGLGAPQARLRARGPCLAPWFGLWESLPTPSLCLREPGPRAGGSDPSLPLRLGRLRPPRRPRPWPRPRPWYWPLELGRPWPMNRHRRTPRPPHRRPRSPLRRLSLRIALRAAISPRPLRPWGFPQLPRCFSGPLPPQCRRLGWPPRAPWRRPRGRVLDALVRAPGWPFGAGPGVSEQAPWRLAIA